MHAFTFELLTEPSSDIDTILEWHWREWSHGHRSPSRPAWRANLLKRLHRNRVPFSFTARVGDHLVGYCAVCHDDLDERFAQSGPWISGTYVVGGARNLGVGRGLLRAVERHAAQLEIDELWLHTGEARAFYERCGWTVAAVKEGIHTDTVMTRALRA